MKNEHCSFLHAPLSLFRTSQSRMNLYVNHQFSAELMNVASELRRKMEQLKSKEIEDSRRERENDANGDIPTLSDSIGTLICFLNKKLHYPASFYL